MGTLSDRTRSRWGRRRPYILFGYILSGIIDRTFPNSGLYQSDERGDFDGGPGGLDDDVLRFDRERSSFNAWTTDIATSNQHGRVEGVLNLSVFLAQIVAMVAAGAINRSTWATLHLLLLYWAGIVIASGFVAGGLLRDAPNLDQEASHQSFGQEFSELFNIELLKQNRQLFILLLFIMITSIGMQVSFPYLIVYLENFIGVTKTEFSVIGGAVMVGSAIVAIPFGILADRWDKRPMMAIALVFSSLGGILLSLVKSLPMLALTGF